MAASPAEPPNTLTLWFAKNQQTIDDEQTKARLDAIGAALERRLALANFVYSIKIERSRIYDRPETAFKERTIAIVNSMKFVTLKASLAEDAPIPILVTEREDPTARCTVPKCKAVSTYYSSMFIRRHDAPIDSLDDPDIKTVFLVDDESASGFLLPLDRLASAGVIASPTLEAARARFHVEEVKSHKEVCTRVATNANAIGAVWSVQDEACEQTEVFLIHGRILQDLVIISKDVQNAGLEAIITDFFKTDPIAGTMQASPLNIYGFQDFKAKGDLRTTQHSLALAQLTDLRERSRGKPGPQPTIPQPTDPESTCPACPACPVPACPAQKDLPPMDHEPVNIGAWWVALLGAAMACIVLGGSWMLRRRLATTTLLGFIADGKVASNEFELRLMEFLKSAFNTSEFLRFIQASAGERVLKELPHGASLADTVHAAISHLNRQAAIGRQFFDALTRAVPARAREIQDLARGWYASR